MRHVNDGYNHIGVWRHRTKWGNDLLVEISRHTIEFKGRPAVLATAVDVTERMAAEMALKDRDALLSAAQRIGNMGTWKVDLVTGRLEWPPETVALFGLEGRNFPRNITFFRSLVHPDDLPRVESAYAAATSASSLIELEYRIIRPDRQVRWMFERGHVEQDEDGHPARTLGLVMDITDRKAMEDRLRRNEAIMGFAARLARFGGWEVSLPDYTVTWTDIVAEIHEAPEGWVPTTEEGLKLYAEEYRQDITAALAKCAQDGTPWDIELELVTCKGNRVWVRTTGEAVRDQSGRIIKLCGAFQDISAKKRSEAILREKDMLLRIAGRVAKIGAWSVEADTHEIHWSDEIFDMVGLPYGDAPTLEQALALYEDSHRIIIQDALTRCLNEGTPFQVEVLLMGANGHEIWAECSGEAHRDATGRIVRVIGAFQDITEEVQARDRLRSSEERFRGLLQNVPRVAVQGYTPEGVIHFWNRASELLYGYTESEAIGQNLIELIVPPENQDEVRRIIRETLANPGSVPFVEMRLLKKDGTRFPVYTNYVVLNHPNQRAELFCIDVDLTQIEDLRAKILESEERFRMVARATVDAIWDWNLIDDTVWWNDAIQNIFGHDLKTLSKTSASWTTIIHPEDATKVLESIHAAIAGETDVWESKYRLMRGDGSFARVVDRGFVIRDPKGRAVRMVGGMTDITKQLQLEEQLRQSQRLESIGQLTGGIAHDFNNLLTVILGNADLLAEMLDEGTKIHHFAIMIGQAALRGSELTHQLLAFARRQPLDPKPTDINRLILGMDGIIRRTLGEHIEIEFVRGAGLWEALVDPTQLESALLNLSINARDAMPSGGRLTIETANVSINREYADRHVEIQPGQYVLIAVSDTGMGIPPELIGRVFEPFFTTKEEGKGTGLGLSMVYGFVKQSKGHIKIYSEPGEGTTLRLYLPRIIAPSKGEDAKVIAAPAGGKETILLVEDDDLVRTFVDTQLRSLGYTVISANNGPSALEILRTDTHIDLLFTDIVMPGGMNGRQLADAARQFRPTLKVLYTSGYTDNAIVHHGRLDPGAHLLSKPYTRLELARKLRELLDD